MLAVGWDVLADPHVCPMMEGDTMAEVAWAGRRGGSWRRRCSASPWALLVAVLAGLAAGGAVGVNSAGPPSTGAERPSEEASPASAQHDLDVVAALPVSAGCDTRRDALNAAVAARTRALSGVALSARWAQAQRVAREGTAQPWTDDVEGRLLPAAVEGSVVAAAEASQVADVLAIDCEEYPCVGVLQLRGGAARTGSCPRMSTLTSSARSRATGSRW